MNPSLVVSFLSLTVAMGLLAGCGGGGDDVAPEPQATAAPVEPGTCVPDRYGFGGLAFNSSVAKVVEQLGCQGLVEPQPSPDVTVLRWQDPANPKRRLLVHFSSDKLFRKVGQWLDPVRQPSTCVPTAAVFGALVIGDATVESTVRDFGCVGEHIEDDWLYGLERSTYQWGEDNGTSPIARVTYIQRIARGKSSARLAP